MYRQREFPPRWAALSQSGWSLTARRRARSCLRRLAGFTAIIRRIAVAFVVEGSGGGDAGGSPPLGGLVVWRCPASASRLLCQRPSSFCDHVKRVALLPTPHHWPVADHGAQIILTACVQCSTVWHDAECP